MTALVDMTGKTCGRLYVLSRAQNDIRGRARWLCLCDCGNIATVCGKELRTGDTVSCGCYRKEVAGAQAATLCLVHGLRNHRLYNTWSSMIHRCYNPKRKRYADYGGRGIKVCERWKSVDNFITDMYPDFVEGLTLDRKDNDGDYRPGNCRWATPKEQANNSRPRRVT